MRSCSYLAVAGLICQIDTMGAVLEREPLLVQSEMVERMRPADNLVDLRR